MRSTPAKRAKRIARMRLEAVKHFGQFKANSLTGRAAARLVGRPFSTLYRWGRAFAATGNKERAWLEFSQGPHCPPEIAAKGFRAIPAPVKRLVQLTPLQPRCWLSADGQRFYFRIPKGVVK